MNQDKNTIYRSSVTAWLYLLPTIFVLAVFIFYPALRTFAMAFYRQNFYLGTHQFIGWENFHNLFNGPFAPGFIQTCIQTVIFSVLCVSLTLMISMILSVLANHKIRGAKIYRMLLIWPFALSPAVAGTIFAYIYNPEVGIINTTLRFLFNVQPGWLTNPILAFVVAVFAAVWKNLGFNIVFYLAALQNIPKDSIEASKIDGANELQTFVHVIFPLLTPTSFFLLFTNITYSLFDSFAIIDVLTRGGPMGQSPIGNVGITTTLMYKIFLDGFGGSANMGFAAAETIILMIIVAVFTLLQFGILGKKVNYDF
ncbi:MAG: glycerol-3-phosphate ABC transporter permease [Treponema sp. CETP13]|nr:MAG: glycerol-3-phosphate ABC transporter permease [Treponema sp. CETP13]